MATTRFFRDDRLHFAVHWDPDRVDDLTGIRKAGLGQVILGADLWPEINDDHGRLHQALDAVAATGLSAVLALPGRRLPPNLEHQPPALRESAFLDLVHQVQASVGHHPALQAWLLDDGSTLEVVDQKAFLQAQAACLSTRRRIVWPAPAGSTQGAGPDRPHLGWSPDQAWPADPASRPAFGLALGGWRPRAGRLWAVAQPVGGADQDPPTPGTPGDLILAAVQAIGHGCDLVAWARWRTASNPSRPGSGGLLPAWHGGSRRLEAVRSLIRELTPQARLIAGTQPLVTVARIEPAALATCRRPWMADLANPATGRRALRQLGLNQDLLAPGELASRPAVQVALLPLAAGLSAREVDQLLRWVQKGGILVVGPLAGRRDSAGCIPDQDQPPGPLARLTGTSCPEAGLVPDGLRIHSVDGGTPLASGPWVEQILPQCDEVRPLAIHTGPWFAGSAAVTHRPLGRGQVLHCGVALQDAVLAWLWTDCGLPRPKPIATSHEPAVEILTRVHDRLAVHFLLNHGPGPAVFNPYRASREPGSTLAVTSAFTLPGQGWRMLVEDLDSGIPADRPRPRSRRSG